MEICEHCQNPRNAAATLTSLSLPLTEKKKKSISRCVLFERQLFNLHRARPPSPWVLADMSSCDIWGGETGTSRGWLAIRRWLSPADARDISPHLWRRRRSRQTSANSCALQRRARGERSLLPCAWGANILQAPCDFLSPYFCRNHTLILPMKSFGSRFWVHEYKTRHFRPHFKLQIHWIKITLTFHSKKAPNY